MNNGFFRVATAVPAVNVADCPFNSQAIVDIAKEAYSKGVSLLVTPEMSVTGYTCGDLFHNSALQEAVGEAIDYIAHSTAHMDMIISVGAPVIDGCAMYNCAIWIAGGRVIAAVPKTYIPNYNEFYEKRWWKTGIDVNTSVSIGSFHSVPLSTKLLVEIDSVKIGVDICEDLWTPCPPSSIASMAGADVIVNLSASNDIIGKYRYLCSLVSQQSARCICGYIYSGAGFGESSTDLVFDGKALIYENGKCIASNERWSRSPQLVVADLDIYAIRRDRLHMGSFSDSVSKYVDHEEWTCISSGITIGRNEPTPKLIRHISQLPFVPEDDRHINERACEIINIQIAGLARRLLSTHTKSIVVGISGGLDSTLALLVAAKTFDSLGIDKKCIIGVTMPGFGTTGRTHSNAIKLMESLGITIREIPIVDAVNQHFHDIGHDSSIHDVTYENSQARERTQLLMDIANQVGGMVLGTGDLSELALGWATYNGDHMSMYGINAGIPKTLVRYLVRWFAIDTHDDDCKQCLMDIIDTPISPELIPADEHGDIVQKTEDLVGPYELHDFFLYYTLRYGFDPKRIYMMACHAFEGSEYDTNVIKYWITVFFQRFFRQQFKRSCLPDGPKVGSVCLSPRGDWRMPSDASSEVWLSQCKDL